MTNDDVAMMKLIANNSEIREILILAKNGIPFDVAVELSVIERHAWIIAFGEIEGGSFDWESMRWRERK